MRFIATIVLLLSVAACTSNYNATLYPYQDNRSQLQNSEIRQVMIATSNYGIPSRHYLTRYEAFVDSQLQNYLKHNGFVVQGNKGFEQQWKQAEDRLGPLFNVSTGQKTQAYDEAIRATASHIFSLNPNLQALIFTDLIESPVQYQMASKRFAEWHGTRRRVKLEGIGENIPEYFDWTVKLDAISIEITMINRDNDILFHSIGGIQVAQALVLGNNSAAFKRRNDLLENAKEINEGIALALHPLIKMKNYPQKPE